MALFVSKISILQTLSIKTEFIFSLSNSYSSTKPVIFLKLCFPVDLSLLSDLVESASTNSSEHQKVPGLALAAILEVKFIAEPK